MRKITFTKSFFGFPAQHRAPKDAMDLALPPWQTILALLLIVLAGVDILLSFLGITAILEFYLPRTFIGVTTTVVLSAAVAALTGLVWGFVAMVMRKGRGIAPKLAIGKVSIVFGLYALLVSGIPNIYANTSQPAMLHDASLNVPAIESLVANHMRQTESIGTILPALRTLEAAPCTLAEKEAQEGILTGARGMNGSVYANLAALCGSTKALRIDIEAQHAALTDEATRYKARVEDLVQALSDRNSSAYGRLEQYTQTRRAVEAWVDGSDPATLMTRVRIAIDVIENSLIDLAPHDGELGRKQVQALESLKSNVSKTTGTIRNATTELVKAEPNESRDLVLRTPTAAILAHWKEFVPLILIGCGMPIAPLFLVLITGIAAWGKRPADRIGQMQQIFCDPELAKPAVIEGPEIEQEPAIEEGEDERERMTSDEADVADELISPPPTKRK